MEFLMTALITGFGATATMDLWGIARERFFALPRPDYGLVGRWVGHMIRGRFRHDSIKTAPAVRGELALGWIVHYATGFVFAALLIGVFGLEWVRHPTLGPALAIGVGTVAAPFLVMQPAMGAGLCARRAPNPRAARTQSLVNHAVFGVGLYTAGWGARAWLLS